MTGQPKKGVGSGAAAEAMVRPFSSSLSPMLNAYRPQVMAS